MTCSCDTRHDSYLDEKRAVTALLTDVSVERRGSREETHDRCGTLESSDEIILRSSHVSTPSQNRAAHSAAIYSQTRQTDRLIIFCPIAPADIFALSDLPKTSISYRNSSVERDDDWIREHDLALLENIRR